MVELVVIVVEHRCFQFRPFAFVADFMVAVGCYTVVIADYYYTSFFAVIDYYTAFAAAASIFVDYFTTF